MFVYYISFITNVPEDSLRKLSDNPDNDGIEICEWVIQVIVHVLTFLD